MAKSNNRKRKNGWYMKKYEELGFDMDSIITKYFLQDIYYSNVVPKTTLVGNYSTYCTNRGEFYREGGLLL